jgi:hypothetical protein
LPADIFCIDTVTDAHLLGMQVCVHNPGSRRRCPQNPPRVARRVGMKDEGGVQMGAAAHLGTMTTGVKEMGATT